MDLALSLFLILPILDRSRGLDISSYLLTNTKYN